MKTSIFKSQISGLKLLIGFLSLVVFALIAFTFLNYQSLSSFKKEEKIVLVPLSLEGDFWVKDDDFSDGYFNTMQEIVEMLYFDQTASNVARNNRHLLKLVSEKSYIEIKKHLKEKAGLLKRYPNTVFHFNTNNKITINRGKHVITRKGKLRRSGISGKINNQAILFKVEYEITHGLFKVMSLNYEKI